MNSSVYDNAKLLGVRQQNDMHEGLDFSEEIGKIILRDKYGIKNLIRQCNKISEENGYVAYL